jgi:transcriptional regulator with XRE-family HTH domain
METKIFSDWLNAELIRRDMSQADLARDSGLTTAAISRFMSGSRNASAEACSAIAKALNLPPEVVFREAGLLPPEREAVNGLAEMREVYSLLPESDRLELLEIARMKLERQEARKKRRVSPRPAEG